MDVRVELEGADRLARVFDKATASDTVNYLKQAMSGTADAVLLESSKIVPVDKGTLKDSGTVKEPVVDQDGIEVEITYGGAASKYAFYVHEDMNANHKDGQTAKYLEIPVQAAARTFVTDVMRRYAARLRSTR